MRSKVFEVYDFKVVDGTATRSRISNFLNFEWDEFLKCYALYEKQENEWSMLCENLYSRLDLIAVYISVLEGIGLIRLSRSEAFYEMISDYKKQIFELQLKKPVIEE